ncbi:LYR motif-containing protein [Platanthera guangdongensis]|uniref:LYR motif-containing protein n=1 Tax=Platanthera guangdongensis TaxID=2320717 RepID=A0ABR2MKD1_9ASPA
MNRRSSTRDLTYKTSVTLMFKTRAMEKGLKAYMEVLRLVRRLPADARIYYAKYARENFVNYRELEDPSALPDLLRRAYNHSLWVLNKYAVDVSSADGLKKICSSG